MSMNPPSSNPILSAYEQFLQETPFVTRSVLTTLGVTWTIGCFVDLSYSTSTTPHFCIFNYELYRIVISPFICQSAISLLFAFLSFTDNGKRLEYSMGSSAFGWFLLTIALCTNVIFLAFFMMAYLMTGDPTFLWHRSIGIWTILFGLIAAECSRAPHDSKRRLFFFVLPTCYYPIAMWALFTLMGGLNAADLISVAVGYAYGYGWLDKLKLGPSRFNQWEETIFSNFTQRPGWISGHVASGDEAWTNNSISYGISVIPPLSSVDPPTHVGTDRTAAVIPAFPVSGGHTLGSSAGPVRRCADRSALLAAAEKRAATKQPQNEGDEAV